MRSNVAKIRIMGTGSPDQYWAQGIEMQLQAFRQSPYNDW